MPLDLRHAEIVNYFSMPSPSLAEQNPDAYNRAMAELPPGSGSCAHCGTGIIHHVVVQCDGNRFFIGTTCAEKVGDDTIRRCVRAGLTSAQLAIEDAKHREERETCAKLQIDRDAKLQGIAVQVADLADRLADGRNGFRDSIAASLRRGCIPEGRGYSLMVEILAKQVGRRGSKAYSEAYVQLCDRLDPVLEQLHAIYR